MALSLSTIAAKDSAGTAIAGGLLAGDKSGAGTGPFVLGNLIVDGLAGTNVAAVTAANAIKVDGSAVTQPVSGTFWQATQPVSGTVAATQSGTWTVQPGNTANTTAWKVQLFDGTTALPILAASTGSPASTAPALAVSVRDANGNISTNADGVATGTNNVAPVGNFPYMFNGTTWDRVKSGVQTTANSLAVALASDQTIPIKATTTTNGTTNSRVVAAATTNATNLKASAGKMMSVRVFNVAAYDVFLKFYNKASAPTVGTDAPVWTIPLKTGTGFSEHFHLGFDFSTGISYAITKIQADTDTTAVAASDVTGTIGWI